jgi:fatty-acyl-CoA synthase
VEIVSRLPNKQLYRSNYAELYRGSRALAQGLAIAGMKKGDRVATMLWNHKWHLEAYLGIPLGGCVLHTLNIRLHPDELAYIVNHAEDRILLVDDVLLPVYESFKGKVHFERVLVVPTCGQKLSAEHERYNDFTASPAEDYEPPQIDENDAAALCYTSGTTGMPKGVVYSHRSMVLHTLCASLPDSHDVKQTDCVLPAVSMFHVNAWGIPYCAVMAGAKLVLPGQYLDGESLLDLLDQERVTRSAGVPTVWMNVLDHLKKHPGRWKLHPELRIILGGSAPPKELIRAMSKHGISVNQAWGMTETGPLGTVCSVKSYMRDLPEEQRLSVLGRQGLPLPFIDVRVNDETQVMTPEGDKLGELEVRGPWVTASYYNAPESQEDKWTPDGWLRTGDVVVIDSEGYIRIVDRTKDMIKSGGEWISSVDLENALMAHPAVREAAVVAIPHPKWLERPVAAVVLKDGALVTPDELRAHLSLTFSNWQLPDAFAFLAEIPHTSVGKIKKSRLREIFASRGTELIGFISQS